MKNKVNEDGIWELTKRFLPLSLTDFAMTFGDTMRVVAISYLPFSALTLASIGIIKSVAIFFESPVIMLLHASTVLSKNAYSRKILFKFMLILSLFLTLIFGLFCFDPFYGMLFDKIFGADAQIRDLSKGAFALLVLWPAFIAWRRFFQGFLINNKKEKFVAFAATLRLIATGIILIVGVLLKFSGIWVAAFSLIGAVFIEAIVVTYFAHKKTDSKIIQDSPDDRSEIFPSSMPAVGKYYLPLALTMVFLWGGRAAIVPLISNSKDPIMALASWTVALGLIMPIANATRMIQQIVISTPNMRFKQLLKFVFLVGILFTLPLLISLHTDFGRKCLFLLLHGKEEILNPVFEIINILTFFPMLVTIQNMLQGIALKNMKNYLVNFTTMINVICSLVLTIILINKGLDGAIAASYALIFGQIVEVIVLSLTQVQNLEFLNLKRFWRIGDLR